MPRNPLRIFPEEPYHMLDLLIHSIIKIICSRHYRLPLSGLAAVILLTISLGSLQTGPPATGQTGLGARQVH